MQSISWAQDPFPSLGDPFPWWILGRSYTMGWWIWKHSYRNMVLYCNYAKWSGDLFQPPFILMYSHGGVAHATCRWWYQVFQGDDLDLLHNSFYEMQSSTCYTRLDNGYGELWTFQRVFFKRRYGPSWAIAHRQCQSETIDFIQHSILDVARLTSWAWSTQSIG